MTTVAEVYGHSVKSGDLGIEIETEYAPAGYKIPKIKGWTNKPDGSLRDFGVEYISDGPVAIGNLKEHLKLWKDGLGDIHKGLYANSVSTSVHVHVNVQNLEPIQVMNFYLCGVLFENVLAKYAGPDREGNLFCLRTIDAENLFTRIKEKAKVARDEIRFLDAFNPSRQQKLYTNVHTIPIGQLGTIEFRVMRGTTDINEIEAWSEVLYNIREFSKEFANPCEILKYLKEAGAIGAMRKVFGEHFERFYYNGCDKDISRNFIYLADMATVRKEWKLEKSTPKVKKLEAYANPFGGVPIVHNNGLGANAGGVVWDEVFEVEDFQ